MDEIWKDVIGYEGLYEVSNYGHVRTHKNKRTWSSVHNTWRQWEQRILKEKNPKGRDVRVSLWKDKKEKSYLVHRLVAAAFIPEVEGKNSVNHIDGNPRNNQVSNLEWCDHKENNNHAFDTGLMATNKPIILVDKESGQPKYFRSMSKAGQHLGKNSGYISGVIKAGKSEVGNYLIFIAIKPGDYGKLIG